MNINNYREHVVVPRDIRRFPSELDAATSRNVARSAEVEHTQAYAEVLASVQRTTGVTRGASLPSAAPATTSAKPFSLWEKQGFGFGDLIDMINPLHHIPVVATIYRNLSGDQIGAAPRVIGGAIWGRIGGFVSGLVNAAVEWWSGKDIGDHVYAAVFGDPKENDGTAMVQKAAPTPNVASRSAVTHGVLPAERAAAGAASELPPRDDIVSAAPYFDVSASLATPAHMALTVYERHRRQGEADESLGIRLPA